MLKAGTITHSIYRGALSFAAFAATAIMTDHPQWGEITIGSIVFALVHYATSQLAVNK